MAVLPQEIQVWYVLPALRREMARMLIGHHGMPQKKAAAILGVSEGAVSQYLSSKRGANVKFSRPVMQNIKAAANRIAEDNSTAIHELIKLSEMDSVKRMICELHIEQDPAIKRECNICFR
ncbi:transcriptional regulator [Candidatus Woesearchaeota archaeon]|nr:transcriptional regulator [Candidatus Woesearchaeota archaeon]